MKRSQFELNVVPLASSSVTRKKHSVQRYFFAPNLCIDSDAKKFDYPDHQVNKMSQLAIFFAYFLLVSETTS